ncbi:MAG: OLD family endonuclease [Bacteroidia bacterium]|nr:OLD family endonuclease [Bacteroidia bacterium]
MFASLKDLARQTDTQVLLSTHSSSFIDMDMYRSICIVKKNNPAEGTRVWQCQERLFAQEDEKKQFNLSYWINPDRGELFFAKKVILVEGVTEKVVLPYLAKILGIFRYDYTLIDCGNKDNILTYLTLLNKFRLRYTVVYDRDHQPHKSARQIAHTNELSQKIEQYLIPELGRSIVLENDLEDELHIQANNRKAFRALQEISHPDYKLPARLEDKVRLVYEEGGG